MEEVSELMRGDGEAFEQSFERKYGTIGQGGIEVHDAEIEMETNLDDLDDDEDEGQDGDGLGGSDSSGASAFIASLQEHVNNLNERMSKLTLSLDDKNDEAKQL